MEGLRIACFVRDRGKRTGCGIEVNLELGGSRPIMHMAHWRNKRMYGDTLDNVTTRCPKCHLVDMHNPKSVPPKG